MLDVRRMRVLREVAARGSFSAAAEALAYTQSAVSQQIAALERAVGVQLIERPGGPRPVSLSEAGVVLDRHAIGVLARLSEARADLESLVSGSSGTVFSQYTTSGVGHAATLGRLAALLG
jgi:DNA-binding transcriptional LysR family regulator